MSFANSITAIMLALALMFAPMAAYAQPPVDQPETTHVQRYHLPDGMRWNIHGETYQCFDLDEYRALLRMDQDLRAAEILIPNLEARVTSYGNAAQQLQIALDLANEEIEVFQRERVRLTEQWTEENRLRLEAENRPIIGDWFGWGFAAVEAIALAILAGVIATHD